MTLPDPSSSRRRLLLSWLMAIHLLKLLADRFQFPGDFLKGFGNSAFRACCHGQLLGDSMRISIRPNLAAALEYCRSSDPRDRERRFVASPTSCTASTTSAAAIWNAIPRPVWPISRKPSPARWHRLISGSRSPFLLLRRTTSKTSAPSSEMASCAAVLNVLAWVALGRSPRSW